MAGGRWLHVSRHVLAPTAQFSFISPSLMNQPDVCFCSQPLDFALFSLDCIGLLLSALGLWSFFTCQFNLLVLSLQLFPLNPSICFLSTSAHLSVSLVADLPFLFSYPVFLLYLLYSWDMAKKVCRFVYVSALAGQVRPYTRYKMPAKVCCCEEGGCLLDLGYGFQRFRGMWVRQPCPWRSPLFLCEEQEAWM